MAGVKTLGSVIVAMVMLAAQTVAAALLVLAPWKLMRMLRGAH